ncbi:alcohol dehydrogenase catalytic domain-containing protein [Streptomyces mayteni]
MLSAVATAANAPLTVTEREVPEPGPGEVLVGITACGICHTDLDLLQGHWPIARFPVVPGHEITGVVAATGPGVTFPEVGTAVGAQFLGDSCRTCDYCVRGEQILCPGKRITGIVMDGGYTEYAVLEADFVTPLPDGLDPVAAAPLMCAGLTAFNGLRRGGITATSRVAVIGAGGLGALPGDYRRDRTWYRACLSRSLAGIGEPEAALAVALDIVPDAAEVGRPHSWNELHTTAATLLRKRPAAGRQLVAALREQD